MSVVSAPLVLYWSRVFYVFLKCKKGMPAVAFMTTPLPVYTLPIHSTASLVQAINSLKNETSI